MLYTIIVLVTMIVTIGLAIIVHYVTGTISLLYAILCPLFINAYLLLMLGVCCLIMRLFVPKKVWNAEKKIFRVNPKEIKFYEKIGIRKWKALVPEKGATTGLAKDKIVSTDPTYLKYFLNETCFAEFYHYVTAIIGFTVLFFIKVRDLYFALPILFVNLFLHILPCFIQRYVRCKMLKVYQYRKSKINQVMINQLNNNKNGFNNAI